MISMISKRDRIHVAFPETPSHEVCVQIRDLVAIGESVLWVLACLRAFMHKQASTGTRTIQLDEANYTKIEVISYCSY